MANAILYFKNNNEIHDITPDVIDIKIGKIEYIGGYVEGYSEDEIGIIVVEGFSLKVKEILNELVIDLEGGEKDISKLPSKIERWLENSNGETIRIGDVLPEGLVDLYSQFKNKTVENLEYENKQLKKRLDLVENAILDLAIGGM